MHAQLENYIRLNKAGSYSSAELAGYQRAVDQREQQLKLSKINAEHNIASVQSTLDAAKLKLAKMTIRADFDVDGAIVATVNKNPGELIGQGDPLATLITKSKRVEGKISEQDSAKMAVGDEVTVTFISYGSFEFNGKISKILATADPLTQRRRIWIDLPEDPKQPFDPGMNGEMSIIVDKHKAKAIVPRRAIFPHNGDAVWVVHNGVVEERRVKRGFVWASGAEITEGLEPGEQVIVDELESFKAGEAVTPKLMPGDALRATK
jgi:RND family efflux transporter MFP subunit